MEKISKSFCVLPWIGLMVGPNGDTFPCCTSNHELPNTDANLFKNKDIDKIRNCSDLGLIREEMLSGRFPKTCERCFLEETNGKSSSRSLFNDIFSDQIPKILESKTSLPSLKRLEIKIGNQCNLSCRMCWPGSSSLLLEEHKRFFSLDPKRIEHINSMNRFLKDEDWIPLYPLVPNLREIYFTGGEPLQNSSLIKFLENIVEMNMASELKIALNTNATKDPNSFIELFKNFKEVRIICSLEGFGELNDYIRHGSKWSQIRKNIEKLTKKEDFPTVKVTLNTVASLWNIMRLDEVYLYFWKEFETLLNESSLSFALGHWDNIKILPSPLKEIVKRKMRCAIKALYQTDTPLEVILNLKRMLSFMESEDLSKHWEEFVYVCNSYDKSRNQSIFDHIPEYKNYWHLSKENKEKSLFHKRFD